MDDKVWKNTTNTELQCVDIDDWRNEENLGLNSGREYELEIRSGGRIDDCSPVGPHISRRLNYNVTDWSTLPPVRLTFTLIYAVIIVCACTGASAVRIGSPCVFLHIKHVPTLSACPLPSFQYALT
jgi:hypothetical protein